MGNHYILDTRLGDAHYVICSEAVRRNVIEPEDLNEGRRTMAEQWYFYRHQPPLAAFPRPTAPHIMLGHENHAIDANSFNGAVRRLAHFYESQGCDVTFEVPGESWHFRPHDEKQLIATARKIERERDSKEWHKGERGTPVKFFKHQLYIIHDPQTKRAYYAAGRGKPKGGWDPVFNEEFKKAVMAFQHDHKLKQDGVIGPATDRAIDKAYSKAMKKRRGSAKERAKARQSAYQRGEL